MGKQQQPLSTAEELREATRHAHEALKDLRTAEKEIQQMVAEHNAAVKRATGNFDDLIEEVIVRRAANAANAFICEMNERQHELSEMLAVESELARRVMQGLIERLLETPIFKDGTVTGRDLCAAVERARGMTPPRTDSEVTDALLEIANVLGKGTFEQARVVPAKETRRMARTRDGDFVIEATVRRPT